MLKASMGNVEKAEKKGWITTVSLTGLAVIFVIVFVISFSLGEFHISLHMIVAEIRSKFGGPSSGASPAMQMALWQVRLPRILAAALVGAALSLAGSAYQGLFRNPMVSPDLLGASTGAGFGAAVALTLSFNIMGVSILAFAMGLLAVALSYAVSNAIGKSESTTLLLVLTGMVVSSMFSAFTSIIKYVADPDNKLPAITFWLMGGLSSITFKNLAMLVPPLVVGTIPMLLLRWKLNVLTFGDEEARALGVNTKRLQLIFIFCATLLTAASVAVSGMIGWVGLVIPHVARLIVGPNYRRMLPASMLCGATFLILADDVARTAFTAEVPLGILTSIIGAPFFIFLLYRGRRKAQ